MINNNIINLNKNNPIEDFNYYKGKIPAVRYDEGSYLRKKPESFPEVLERLGLLGSKIRITSGHRKPGEAGNAGARSNHTKLNKFGLPYAYDIVPVGMSFTDLDNLIRDNVELLLYLMNNNYRIIREDTADAIAKYGSTGRHWHLSYRPGSTEGTAFRDYVSEYYGNKEDLQNIDVVNDSEDIEIPLLGLGTKELNHTSILDNSELDSSNEDYSNGLPAVIFAPVEDTQISSTKKVPQEKFMDRYMKILSGVDLYINKYIPEYIDEDTIRNYEYNSTIPSSNSVKPNLFYDGGDTITSQFLDQVLADREANLSNAPNIFRKKDGTYVYLVSPTSNEISVEPINTVFEDPSLWTYRDLQGRLYTPRSMGNNNNQGTITLKEDGPILSAVNNYLRELLYKWDNNIPIDGKYTMPAIAAAAAMPLLGEAAYPVLSNPYVDAGITSAFGAHGLNHAINEGVDGYGDAVMTAMEIAPLGRLVKPLYNTVKPVPNFVPTLDSNLVGVRYAYSRNSELADIGTLEEYNDYIKTIFPESKVRDINYHMGPKGLQELRPSKGDFFNTNPKARGIYVTPDKSYSQSLRRYTTDRLEKPPKWTYFKRQLIPGGWDKANEAFTDIYPVMIDVKNPLYTKGAWTWGIGDKKYKSLMDNYDAIINSGPRWYENFHSMPESIVPKTLQTLILGSDADVAGFRRFMSSPQITSENAASITPKYWTDAQDAAVAKALNITPEEAASLTREQWDAAIARGIDTEEIQRLRDLHFKVKAPNTKTNVPLWTSSEEAFNSFDLSHFGETDLGFFGYGHYLTPMERYAAYYHPINRRFYVNMENPYIGDYDQYFNRIQYIKDRMARRKENMMHYLRDGDLKSLRKLGIDENTSLKDAEHLINKYITDETTRWSNKYVKYADEFEGKDGVLSWREDQGIPNKQEGIYKEVVVPKGEQIKSADAITFDDNGIRIPLGKRDNFNKNDIRYGFIPPIAAGLGLSLYNLDNQMLHSLGGPLNKFEEGGNTDDTKYQAFLEELKNYAPNLAAPSKDYNMRRYWELRGKPSNWEEALRDFNYIYNVREDPMFTLENDGAYHAPSTAFNLDTGIYEFMKSADHPTVKYELNWYDNGDETGPNGLRIPSFEGFKSSQDFKKNYELLYSPIENKYYYIPKQR